MKMQTSLLSQARIAMLYDPAGLSRGVGPDAVEALLTTWAKTPVALGHREDGSPYLIGIEGKFLSLSHAKGMTALALSDVPVGIDISPVELAATDRKVAAKLFSAGEREWLQHQPTSDRPAAFALLWTLKEALLKRNRQGLDQHELPDTGRMLGHLDPTRPPATLAWRPWMTLTDRPLPAGLQLSLPGPQLGSFGDVAASAAIVVTPRGAIALSFAGTE